MDWLTSAAFLGVVSDASCPEVDPVGCLEEGLPDHVQEGGLYWLREVFMVSHGLGRGWAISAAIPIDFRTLDLGFTLPNGDPYEPSYMEKLESPLSRWGIGDVEIAGSRAWIWPVDWTLAARLGLQLPTGAAESDPFGAGRVGGLQRQLQIGTGALQSTVSVLVVKGFDLWRAYASARLRLPWAPNSHGYQPGVFLGLESGVSRRLGSRWDALWGVALTHGEPDRWGERTYPGSEAINVTTALTHHLSQHWLSEIQVHHQVWDTLIGAVGEDQSTITNTQVTVGLSWRD